MCSFLCLCAVSVLFFFCNRLAFAVRKAERGEGGGIGDGQTQRAQRLPKNREVFYNIGFIFSCVCARARVCVLCVPYVFCVHGFACVRPSRGDLESHSMGLRLLFVEVSFMYSDDFTIPFRCVFCAFMCVFCVFLCFTWPSRAGAENLRGAFDQVQTGSL